MQLEHYTQQRDRYIDLAKRAEANANARTEQIKVNVRRSLERRYPKFKTLALREQEAQVRDVMLENRKIDAVWKGHVADNQWYIQQAIMYGTAVNGELLQRLVHALPDTQAFSSRL